MCRRIGEHTLALFEKAAIAHAPDALPASTGILTHCNAGTLATGGIGTATAGMYLAHQRGDAIRVFADETRPLLQGARLTAYEL
jgi:methylthioribose-1-phosphate isomerase